ncbi:unnamed protein product [Linum tenue]|uniref:Cytochrome P450 n=1 Tax=Linum tenue TaxID=586396 RepID=A0AAV0IBK3_9ROSI|nr:unnamed protein product [Linum tenue]
MALPDFQATIWLLVLLLLHLAVLIIKNKINLSGRKNSNLQQIPPPGPPKLPILGNLYQLGALPHQSLWRFANKYGPVMQFHFGRMPAVIISSPEAAQEVMKVHDIDTCSRPSLVGTRRLTYNYLDVGFSPYGDNWRFMRKMIILELFSVKRVKAFRFVREEEVGLLIDSISEISASGSTFDLTEKCFSLTANITFRMSFGFNYHGSDFDKGRFHEVIHEAQVVMGTISGEECFPRPFGWIVDKFNGHQARIERVFHELDTFYRHVIDEHLKPGREGAEQDMIDVMLAIEKEQFQLHGRKSQFRRENIKAVFLNLFLGGIDTAALTVTWAMAELLANPRLMKKAQDEVRVIVGEKGRVTEDDLENLEYMKLVIKETLRLHPPAPLLLPREASSHLKISGYDIAPKTMIYVNAWGMGRDPNYWKNADKFMPERFADSSLDFRGHDFEYLPFGAGRRICPGINMGIISVEIALANLLYCFDWKLPNGMKPQDITMEEKTGASLSVARKEPLILVPVNWLNK